MLLDVFRKTRLFKDKNKNIDLKKKEKSEKLKLKLQFLKILICIQSNLFLK